MTVREQRKKWSLVDGTLRGSHLISDLLSTGQEILPKAASEVTICFSTSEKTPQACPPSLLLSPHCSFHFTHFLQLLCPRCQLLLALIGGPQLTV